MAFSSTNRFFIRCFLRINTIGTACTSVPCSLLFVGSFFYFEVFFGLRIILRRKIIIFRYRENLPYWRIHADVVVYIFSHLYTTAHGRKLVRNILTGVFKRAMHKKYLIYQAYIHWQS